MQRLVRICRIETLLDQAGRQHLGRGAVSDQLIGLGGFTPDIVGRRRKAEFVVRADAVRRDDVLAEVLILVVAPHQDEIRIERVERGACTLHPAYKVGAMTGGRGGALVGAPFRPHRRGPALRGSKVLRQLRVLQHAPEDSRHAVVAPSQRRIMRDSKRQDFSHRFLHADQRCGPVVAKQSTCWSQSVAIRPQCRVPGKAPLVECPGTEQRSCSMHPTSP